MKKINMDRCILLYDRINNLKNKIRDAFYIRCEKGINQYISSNDLAILLKKVKFLLFLINSTCKEIASVKNAATYIKRGFEELTAYKRLLENKVRQEFGQQNSYVVLECFMKMAEYLDHFYRFYEYKKEKTRWAKKIARLRSAIRNYSFICKKKLIAPSIELLKFTLKFINQIHLLNVLVV